MFNIFSHIIEVDDYSTIYFIPLLQESCIDSILLQDFEKERLSTIKGKARRAEFLTVRAAINALFPSNYILYSNEGAPYLARGEKHISISHSSDFAAIMVSDRKCGIDIERWDRDFSRVANRFLYKNDYKAASNLERCKVWCCKEALYKLLGGKIDDMLQKIEVRELFEDKAKCSALGSDYLSEIKVVDSVVVAYFTL